MKYRVEWTASIEGCSEDIEAKTKDEALKIAITDIKECTDLFYDLDDGDFVREALRENDISFNVYEEEE